ncbi:hypothetical protein LCGC14_1253950 [marine sediment metagenome]|uniref:NAD(+) synthase (glutamine-hydrolyzing) n=1 Tax=marine sediment metagenome TaxID=412755 RepID=A0A0F9LNW3_9ZZZZ
MKVMLCQTNATIGDVAGNTKILKQGITEALQAKADVVLFPEMVTTGYPPRDLLYRQDIWDQQPIIADMISSILQKENQQLTVIYGGIQEVKFQPYVEGKGHMKLSPKIRYARFNTAYVIDKAYGIRTIHKQLLPCYDVFDETRYFVRGKKSLPLPIVVTNQTVNCDVLICEDIWSSDEDIWSSDGCNAPASYNIDPVSRLEGNGPLFVLNASPYWKGKITTTKELVSSIAKRLKRTVCWCNQIGAHDDIVTGGYSMIAVPTKEHTILRMAKSFAEDTLVATIPNKYGESYELPEEKAQPKFCGKEIEPSDLEMWNIYNALKLHIQDYCRRTGFKTVVLGLSGGIDSALVAAIAADALGGENVIGITMPSKFSSKGSVTDAQALALNLKMPFMEIPIGDIHQCFRDVLLSGGKQEFIKPVTDENIQPRARMTILMATSNDYNALLLTTGNKSEITVGFSTLYGDQAGGLAVISDLWKTEVYELCEFINKYRGEVIPQCTMSKPPSPELCLNQRDTDSLPRYEILDLLLKALIEDEKPMDELMKISGLSKKSVDRIVRLYANSEFKRVQLCIGCKISLKAYGSGRRMPIACKLTRIKF